MAPSPSRDSGWQAAAPDTLWQDQGSPLAVSGSTCSSALLFGFLDLFLHACSDLYRCGCGGLGFFPIMFAHGRRFPLADPLPHKGLTVSFPYILAFHEQINDRDIAPVVIDLKFALAEPREQPWADVPVSLKGEA